MRSNDDVPRDEMLLAEAIAAATRRNMKHGTLVPFRDKSGIRCGPREAVECCVLGALVLARAIPPKAADYGSGESVAHNIGLPEYLLDAWHGNDREEWCDQSTHDAGEESIGDRHHALSVWRDSRLMIVVRLDDPRIKPAAEPRLDVDREAMWRPTDGAQP